MSELTSADHRYVIADEVADAVAAMTEPDDRVAVLWTNAAIHWYADRASPFRHMWFEPLENFSGAAAAARGTITGPDPPAVVVIATRLASLDPDGEVAGALAAVRARRCRRRRPHLLAASRLARRPPSRSAVSMLIEGLPSGWPRPTAGSSPDGPGGECVLIDAPRTRRSSAASSTMACAWPPSTTHGHIDHIGGVGSLVHGLEHGDEIEVRIHDGDKHMLDPIGTSGAFGAYLEGLDLRPPEVIHSIDDGERIRGCGMTFTAIHTPGHTQGSVCFGLEIDGHPPVLFSGDHLFAGSIGRTDLPGGSMEQLMISMAERILPSTRPRCSRGTVRRPPSDTSG